MGHMRTDASEEFGTGVLTKKDPGKLELPQEE